MKVHKLDQFWGGWFVGNFEPAIVKSDAFEVCVKNFRKGDTEPVHFQKASWEITAVVSGTCKIGDLELAPGDIVMIEPMEPAGFLALSDCSIVAVKSPSLPSDKILGVPN